MEISDKDKEILRLRAMLQRRNKSLKIMRAEAESVHLSMKFLLETINDLENIVYANSGRVEQEEQEEGVSEDSIISKVFGDKLVCTSCGSPKVIAYSFCAACFVGWAYCKKCGGFESCKVDNENHVTPTHGIFLNMFDKNEFINSKTKPN